MFVANVGQEWFTMNEGVRGEIGSHLLQTNFDPGFSRPFVNTVYGSPAYGQVCCTINAGFRQNTQTGQYEPHLKTFTAAALRARGFPIIPVTNATALRKEEWIQLDREVIKAARERLRAWADLEATNSYGGFNGMSRMTLEYEAMSDPGEALVDMDGISASRNDMPLFSLRSIPLPITHSGSTVSARKLAVSRNSGSPLDLTMMEAAGRRIGEMLEKTLIGTVTGTTYGTQSTGVTAHTGTSTVYGYRNFPYRLTSVTMTAPTGSNQTTILGKVLDMRAALQNNKFYGPYMIYTSTDWDRYLDEDYQAAGGNNPSQTLRDRIRAIEGIQDIRRLDYLTSTSASPDTFTMIMVQMTSDVCRAVNGMDLTTVQWEDKDGAQLNLKAMCIKVPQLRYDYNGNCGILHAKV